jgi:lipopolysaccharide transport system ATP-binding protein
MSTVIRVENVSKQYRLGEVGTGTLSHDLNRWWHKVRGKDDPYSVVGETNDRKVKGHSDYIWALKNINFDVQDGEVLGIVGGNGAGKSTLLKILSRVTAPSTGEIKIKGRIASLLEVGTGFNPELTGRDNIFLNGAILGMSRKEIRQKFDEIVAFAEVERYIDTPVKRYSSGMYVRLAFAVAAHLEPEILIVDEVLAVGDAEFQNKCLGKMQDISRGGRTVLFVSHSESSIRRLCSKALFLDKGMVGHIGSPQEVFQRYRQNHSHSGFTDANRVHSSLHAKITNASLCMDGISTVTVLPASQPSLRLDLDVHIPVKASFEVLLRDANSFPVMFAPVGLATGFKYDFKTGFYSVSMELKLPHLAEGRYSLDLMIVESGVRFFEYLQEAITFLVLPDHNPSTGWKFSQARNQGCILLETSIPEISVASPPSVNA